VVYKSENSISGITQDVTVKEEIQQKLRNSEANLKALFESTTYGFVLLDLGLYILSFNEAARKIALKITGMEPSVGDELKKYMMDPFQDDLSQMVANACLGQKQEDELALNTNGTVEWFNIQLVPVKNQQKLTTNISLIIRDITEKKAQEERIISLNDRLKFAADIGNVGWWEWDYPSGKVIFDDKKATLLGYQPSDFSHVEDFKNLIHPDDYDTAITRMTEHLTGRSECFEIIYRLRRKEGSYHWFYDKGFVTKRFEDNRPKTIKGAILDIHQLKTSQENLLLQNQELRKSNHELDTFVYRISHDMRAPLSSAMGLIDLCQSEKDLEKVKHYLKLQYRSLKKMDDFIYDIVDYSKNSRVEVKPEKILIRKFIVEMLSQFSYHPTASNIRREIQVEGTPYFYADLFRMRIIFQNLLSNAFRYSKKQSSEGYVKISVTNDHNNVYFVVEDNGIGIEPIHLPKVFDMFYRATVQDPGEGLGLYIVKEAVVKSGGTIEVVSCFKKWTRFKVVLPFLLQD
jgi:PAS domain S-box-containing protein